MTEPDRSRRVRLVLCGRDGEPVGALPWFVVDDPWWPEVEPVVRAARDRFGVDAIVLRLLSAETDSTVMGGSVSYLAEVDEVPRKARIEPVDPDIAGPDSVLRAYWARPGGVEATIAWADAHLAAIGRPRTDPAVQVKTWNLSSILRLPTSAGDAWCKSVPPFMAHEGAIIALVGAKEPSLVPVVLAAHPRSGTVLMVGIEGEDQWEAPEDRLVGMVHRLVALQARWIGDVPTLLSAGLPDVRARAFMDTVSALLRRADVRSQLTADELDRLDGVVADLPRRLAALRGCGLPDTLVHGDFHPGNWRSSGGDLVLVDWGDSGVGHPLLDLPGFLQRVPEGARERVRSAWLDAWHGERPDADVQRAAELIPSIAALYAAVTYQRFLDHIEPSERVYHQLDVPICLRRALTEG